MSVLKCITNFVGVEVFSSLGKMLKDKKRNDDSKAAVDLIRENEPMVGDALKIVLRELKLTNTITASDIRVSSSCVNHT